MMRYSIFPYNSMPFNRNLSYSWDDFLIGFRDIKYKNKVSIKKLSKYSFDIKSTIRVQYNVAANSEKYIYFYHTCDKKIKKLDIKTFEILEVQGFLFPQFKWKHFSGFHNLKTNQYEILDKKNNKVFEFNYEYPIVSKWYNFGLLLFQNDEKENNWLKCLEPNGGTEKWQVEFPWKIIRLELHKNLILLEYQAYDNIRTDKGYEGERDWYNPNSFTIALNGETGEEIWRHPFAYSKIDHENGVILSGSGVNFSTDSKVLEVDITTGAIKTDVTVSPNIQLGYYPHFVDKEGIYYTTHEGSFGKINKTDGSIIWEFDLRDTKGKKRKLSDWILLGNGNLVLQVMPNHPNGDLTCIFNPEENIEYTKIKDGIRVTTNST